MNQQDPYNYNVVLPTSSMATISLVAGILGFTLFPFIASIVALLTGYAARKETRAVPPTAGGDGLATAGIVMGWIGVGLGVIGFCCVVIYFVFVAGVVGWSFNQ